MKYRSEIDGLRAVAILPVIAFHAHFPFLTGGYVGVDVFFVISGYLITLILLGEIAEGRQSIIAFYERRARRILPTLFVVLAAVWMVAYFWMLPTYFKDFSRSLGATSIFIANIHFLEWTDYFATDAELTPLLHMWSLSFEEQYYLLFPLLLIAMRRQRWEVQVGILTLCLLASLAVSEWGWRNKPDENFFFSFSRFWELLVGSLCAFILHRRGAPLGNGILAAIGLGLILGSVLGFDAQTPFPSVYTLVPVAGTALIILFGIEGTKTAAFLSLRPLVGIGLISYSAYLWHQPLLAFARLRLFGEMGAATTAGLSLLTLVLAYATWRWVETPFRRRSGPRAISRSGVFLFSGIGILGFLGIGLWGMADGLPERRAPVGVSFAALGVDEKIRPNRGFGRVCDGTFTLADDCRTSDAPEIVVWGDSYAMHLVDALRSSRPNVKLIQHTLSQCAPVLGITKTAPRYSAEHVERCRKFKQEVIAYIARTPSIRIVVLASPLHMLRDGARRYDGAHGGGSTEETVFSALTATIRDLESLGKQVAFVSPPPTTGKNLGLCLASAVSFGAPLARCDFDLEDVEPHYRATRSFLNRLRDDYAVIMLEELFCTEGRCRASKDGVLLYRDKGHLSHEGSAYVGRAFDLIGRIEQALSELPR
ncbi:acyltransferase family protein [Alisedimentitalea sp. MJ-SS2]|uniref:acyltransferase family protein n=1 Tax=Aliisedimentitalea sp. MJ-SS2 TaxID=3049795 RepID=UPI002912318D|nr:acyltransferase family protein [Alisedimentitalea sp. MJ-SS2]MDU8929419.1 acyltransferase family protein [Alisedimentitalea sp. MJ-SS2]